MNTQGKVFTKEDLNQIQLKLAKFILDGLNGNSITNEESQKMAQYVLSRSGSINNQTDYIRLLREMTNQWQIFDSFLKEELIKEADKSATNNFGQKGI